MGAMITFICFVTVIAMAVFAFRNRDKCITWLLNNGADKTEARRRRLIHLQREMEDLKDDIKQAEKDIEEADETKNIHGG